MNRCIDGRRVAFGFVDELLTRLSSIREHIRNVDEFFKAEYAAQRVVQLRWSFLKQGSKLVVGEEGSKCHKRIAPADRVQMACGLAFANDRRFTVCNVI